MALETAEEEAREVLPGRARALVLKDVSKMRTLSP